MDWMGYLAVMAWKLAWLNLRCRLGSRAGGDGIPSG